MCPYSEIQKNFYFKISILDTCNLNFYSCLKWKEKNIYNHLLLGGNDPTTPKAKWHMRYHKATRITIFLEFLLFNMCGYNYYMNILESSINNENMCLFSTKTMFNHLSNIKFTTFPVEQNSDRMLLVFIGTNIQISIFFIANWQFFFVYP